MKRVLISAVGQLVALSENRLVHGFLSISGASYATQLKSLASDTPRIPHRLIACHCLLGPLSWQGLIPQIEDALLFSVFPPTRFQVLT